MARDVGVRIERGKDATAVVWLEREPVNSMSLEFWRALADALTELERDPKVRATRSTRASR
jgi:3,2-trans-enoyl-CoA isomerase